MELRGAVLDLDGTIYRGASLIPGADRAVAALRERDVRLCLFSNNPTKSRSAFVERLADLGVDVAEREVLSAGTVTTRYLADEHADDCIYLVGSSGLRAQFEAAGLALTDDPESAEVVVGSFYRGFDYDTLRESYDVLRDGATFLGTDPDVVVPTDDGMVPGSGAILKAMAGVAGRDPDRVLGKPSPEAVDAALDALGVPASACLVVGDRLDTDIAFGERAGMTTALVRTGVTTEADLADSDVSPDYVLDSLADVERLLDA